MNPSTRRLLATFFIAAPTIMAALSATVSAQTDNEQVSVEMHAVTLEGIEESLGRVVISEYRGGLVFRPELTGLKHGLHGFHVHEYPDCSPGPMEEGGRGPAKAAGGHFDPDNTEMHAAPWEPGHLGDLPALYFDAKELSEHPVYKHGVDLDDLRGRALIIHHGGDNYENEPAAMGGGGPAAACGIIPEVA